MQELGGAQESGRRPPWQAGRAATRGGLGRPCVPATAKSEQVLRGGNERTDTAKTAANRVKQETHLPITKRRPNPRPSRY